MYKEEICVVKSPCREDMVVHGYRFGKGEQSACILGSVRGNELAVSRVFVSPEFSAIMESLPDAPIAVKEIFRFESVPCRTSSFFGPA